ncbi:MAG: sulfatase-like hydrolase/transferase, partial [Planctomycetota bacterium]
MNRFLARKLFLVFVATAQVLGIASSTLQHSLGQGAPAKERPTELAPANVTEESRPPNIVVLLVDDLGYMDIGPNNPNCFYDTPNVDRLAASGMRFTDGYAANPVCSPTRYSLMTGKYPSR